MGPAKQVVCVLVVAASLVCGVSSSVEDCTFTTSSGKKLDFSPLIANNDTAYVWRQTLWNTDENTLTNTNFSNPVNLMLQVQICKNIVSPIMPEACNATAPAYMYNVDDKSCVALGQLYAASFIEAPFKDGAYLNMFLGDAMTHIAHYQLKLYLICQANITMSSPVLEHVKDGYDAHIRIQTKYAC